MREPLPPPDLESGLGEGFAEGLRAWEGTLRLGIRVYRLNAANSSPPAVRSLSVR